MWISTFAHFLSMTSVPHHHSRKLTGFVVVAVLVASFLWIPVNATQDTAVVSIENPYVARLHVYRGQLHVHSTNSDGCHTPAEVMSIYKNFGYDFVAITDHDHVTTDPLVSGILFIPGSEESITSTRHILNIGGVIDIPNAVPQQVIDAIVAQNGVVGIAHPQYSGYSTAELVGMSGYSLLADPGASVWDALLVSGKHGVYTIDDDDSHCDGVPTCTKNCDLGYNRGWVQVFSDSLSSSAIVSSLRDGNFYASSGPTLSLSVANRVITVTTDASSTIEWIGFNGRLLQTKMKSLTDSYSILGDESYVRVRITRDGKHAWSNPLWVSIQPASSAMTNYVPSSSTLTQQVPPVTETTVVQTSWPITPVQPNPALNVLMDLWNWIRCLFGYCATT